MFICSVAFAEPAATSVQGAQISGTGFGTKTDNGEERSHLNWIWDNAEHTNDFATMGWTSAQCVPNASSVAGADITYSTDLTASGAHRHSTKYITGAHAGGTGWNGGANIVMFAGGETSFTNYYARWYYYEEAPFTYTTEGIKGTWDMRNNKNFVLQNSDSLYAGGGTGISYCYVDNSGLVTYTDDWTQDWGVGGDWSRGIHTNGFGTVSGSQYGAIPNGGEAGNWELWEVVGTGSASSNSSLKVYINGVVKINITTPDFPFDIKGIGIGGYRDRSNNINFRKYFDDIYIDKSWSRVVVGNASTHDESTIREIQIPTSWSDTEISVTWNQGSFENYTPVYIFVVDENGDASNGLEGFFVDGTFYDSASSPSISTIQGKSFISGKVTID